MKPIQWKRWALKNIFGVVAAEMDPQWPEEALAAQAIIARSFTLQKIGDEGGFPEHGAHASTDIEEFQVYSAERINDRVRKAVNKTKGQVAVYRNEFIRGWFHAFAAAYALAGEGLDFKEGNPPYIQIVESPGKEIVPKEEGYWSASFSAEKVRGRLKRKRQRPWPIVDFEISEKGPSGRATRFKINGVEVSAPSLRLALGSTEMRSTYTEDLAVQGDQITLSGVGYGHGVGMCQWGARALAEDNWSARDIVKYFYRDIEIVQAWS